MLQSLNPVGDFIRRPAVAVAVNFLQVSFLIIRVDMGKQALASGAIAVFVSNNAQVATGNKVQQVFGQADLINTARDIAHQHIDNVFFLA